MTEELSASQADMLACPSGDARGTNAQRAFVYAWIGGGIGALFGMFIFHHKTRKWKFRIFVPLSIIVWIGICLYLLY